MDKWKIKSLMAMEFISIGEQLPIKNPIFLKDSLKMVNSMALVNSVKCLTKGKRCTAIKETGNQIKGKEKESKIMMLKT